MKKVLDKWEWFCYYIRALARAARTESKVPKKSQKNSKKRLTNERTYDKIIKCLAKGANN